MSSKPPACILIDCLRHRRRDENPRSRQAGPAARRRGRCMRGARPVRRRSEICRTRLKRLSCAVRTLTPRSAASTLRRARRLPGVHAVFTFADLAPLLTNERLPLQFRTDQLPRRRAPRFVLAKDEVALSARLSPSWSRGRAPSPRMPRLWSKSITSLCRQSPIAVKRYAPGAPLAHIAASPAICSIEFRQSYGDVAAAFARAPHTARAQLSSSTAAAHISIEGRGAVAVYDANEDRLTLWTSTQLAHEVRAFLMRLLQR